MIEALAEHWEEFSNLGGAISTAICAETGNDADAEIENVDLSKVWDSLQGMLHGEWKGYLFSGKDGIEQAWPMVLQPTRYGIQRI